MAANLLTALKTHQGRSRKQKPDLRREDQQSWALVPLQFPALFRSTCLLGHPELRFELKDHHNHQKNTIFCQPTPESKYHQAFLHLDQLVNYNMNLIEVRGFRNARGLQMTVNALKIMMCRVKGRKLVDCKTMHCSQCDEKNQSSLFQNQQTPAVCLKFLFHTYCAPESWVNERSWPAV